MDVSGAFKSNIPKKNVVTIFCHEYYAQRSVMWMWFEDLDWKDCFFVFFWEKIALKRRKHIVLVTNIVFVERPLIHWLYFPRSFKTEKKACQSEGKQLISIYVKTSKHLKVSCFKSFGVMSRITCYWAPGWKCGPLPTSTPLFSAGISIYNVTLSLDDIVEVDSLHTIRWQGAVRPHFHSWVVSLQDSFT